MKHEYETQQVKEDARGRWERVLLALAPPLKAALERTGKHVPCPVHGGRDGFRLFRDVADTGGGICNTCGSFANGFALLMWINGWDFGRTIREVAEQVANLRKALTFTRAAEVFDDSVEPTFRGRTTIASA